MEIDLGFTLIGEDMEGTRTDVSDIAPATVIPIDQDSFFEDGEPWTTGEHAGWVHGVAILTHADRFVCHLTFSFESDPDDSIVVHGVLLRDGGEIGPGRLAVTGGTGKYHKAAGSVEVETRNPKRFSFTL